jgi:hypothetical protein
MSLESPNDGSYFDKCKNQNVSVFISGLAKISGLNLPFSISSSEKIPLSQVSHTSTDKIHLNARKELNLSSWLPHNSSAKINIMVNITKLGSRTCKNTVSIQ